ncbi:CD63 antigen [Drosophila elegans]|uniref:CD63 antigen n=1 Tax=Drosophila elegans TaxID=30023 RepID=UPI0007E7D317|nr:CD63 antigen [Drosophila elegans]XP_017120877.1 CD63 antigen [Drosophila elegans]XP_041566323.1 CD63 antigen [Drosophila elegans]XP_041566324.1 CD63 antigen [Drosophila elegans]
MSLLTGSANAVKYTLFGFNLIFLITGIILIAVGAGVGAVYTGYELFLAAKFFSIPTFLIVIGSFIILISFFGCWGALKENYCLVLGFSIMLAIIFILELAAGISGYVLRNDASKLISTSLTNSLKEYNTFNQNPTTRLWDDVQRHFECCGVNKYEDWSVTYPNQSLPISCCSIPVGAAGTFNCFANTSSVDDRHKNGCLDGFSNYIAAHAVSLGAAGVVIAILQFFGVLFACYIAREIKIRNGITGFI